MNTFTKKWGTTSLVLLTLVGCATGEAAEDTPRLTTAEVTTGDLVLMAEATGTVEPIRSVEVKSKASGEILRLLVDVGDDVEPGALLAEIDPRDVSNRYDQNKADLEVAIARVEISQAQFERSNELLQAGVITQQENESARLDYANAQANLVKAQTNFELAELQLSDVTIRAPMRGTIIQKNVEEGGVIQSASGNVSGGTTLFIMANLDEMQVRTLVDETDMGDLRPGMATTVRVEAFPDRRFQGEVLKIEPQAEVVQNVTMFPVIVNLDNRGGLLKPGMNAEVEILIDRASGVLLVPNGAIVQLSDVGPAAMALGLDVEDMDIMAFMRAGRGNGGGPNGAAAPAGASSPSTGPPQGTSAQVASGQGAPSGGNAMAAIQALRAKAESGEITQDSMRSAMRALRGASGGAGAPAGATSAADGSATPSREVRSAVVFVMGADSIPQPKLIQMGINDWDNTQVVSGLEGNETLVVVGAAQLQAQQQEWLNNIRSRMGGSPFGGGGGPGRGR